MESIRRARQKVADDAPLGFESAALFDAVKSRAARTRPSARLAKLATTPPAIDASSTTTPGWPPASDSSSSRCLRGSNKVIRRPEPASPDDYFLANDDHLQVLIASPKEPQKLVYRFMLNSLDQTNDAFVRENPDPKTRLRDPLIVDVKGYNPDWQHAVHVQSDGWSAEFRIPWKSLTVQPLSGMSLRMNLGRFRSQGLNWERTYWAPVMEMKGDTFERLDVDLFGTVRLE